jgi:DNA-binding GntR family transcriptional regulator
VKAQKFKSEPVSIPFATYSKLKEMIYRGELAAGTRLVERELSKRLLVSRIPLREALIRLQAEGLVRSIHNTASYVVDFSSHDLLEIYSIRRLLEPFAARLAARNIKRGMVGMLRRLCQTMTEFSSQPTYWPKLDECDYEFHRTIVEASQHSRLIRAYDMSQIRILGRRDEYRYLQAVSTDSMAQQHSKIVDILESGNAEKADKASYDHVNNSMQEFLKSYSLPR